jgi:hypothetical protein
MPPTTNKQTSMTNIFNEPVRIQLGGAPGDGVTEVIIKPGESVDFHANLCAPVHGAGTEDVPSIIARESTRTWPDGTRKPTLVPRPSREAKKARGRRPKASRLRRSRRQEVSELDDGAHRRREVPDPALHGLVCALPPVRLGARARAPRARDDAGRAGGDAAVVAECQRIDDRDHRRRDAPQGDHRRLDRSQRRPRSTSSAIAAGSSSVASPASSASTSATTSSPGPCRARARPSTEWSNGGNWQMQG